MSDTNAAPPLAGTWRPTQTMGGKVFQWASTCPECGETIFVLEQPPKEIESGTSKLERCSKTIRFQTPWGTFESRREAAIACEKRGRSPSVEIKEVSKRLKLFDERHPETWPDSLLAKHSGVHEPARDERSRRAEVASNRKKK